VTDPVTPVAPDERISRYIVESSKIKKSEKRVRHTAFLPPKNRKLSVYRTSGMEEAEIWDIGRNKVAEVLKKTLYGRGDLQASDVTTTALRIEPDVQIHPKHANIEGWPDDDERIEQLTLLLAQVTRFVEVPTA